MKNRLKRILASGKPALGCWIGSGDPYVVEMLAELGFDWLLIDTEHFPLSRGDLRTILMACKGSESVPVVRLQSSSIEHFQTALDLGAQGIMVPMVLSSADAVQAVDFCRYPPLGRRGFGPIRAGRYLKDVEQYRKEANDEICLFVQIETPEGVENATEILSTPGIDGLFIGNGDLASFMNGNGQVHAQNVDKFVDSLVELANRSSVPVGLCSWSTEEFRHYAQRGAQLMTIGADLFFLSVHAKAELLSARHSLQQSPAPAQGVK